jgi:hypothetical protein
MLMVAQVHWNWNLVTKELMRWNLLLARLKPTGTFGQ